MNSSIRRLWERIRSMFAKRKLDDDLSAELAAHRMKPKQCSGGDESGRSPQTFLIRFEESRLRKSCIGPCAACRYWELLRRCPLRSPYAARNPRSLTAVLVLRWVWGLTRCSGRAPTDVRAVRRCRSGEYR